MPHLLEGVNGKRNLTSWRPAPWSVFACRRQKAASSARQRGPEREAIEVMRCQRPSCGGSGPLLVMGSLGEQDALAQEVGFARPYICLLIILMPLTWPSTAPEL
jgi:hypothetical protein